MTAELTATFVLPDDVLLIPVNELAPETRAKLRCVAGDVAVTRPRARRPSSVLDANGARLIALFRTPSRVVDAVLRFSRSTDTDPRVVLESAFPLVARLVRGGVLVPADDLRERAIVGSIRRGDTFGDLTIIDRVDMMEDVEVHRARSAAGTLAVLKIARAAHAGRLRVELTREAAILRRLDGQGAPIVLAAALDEPIPYLALSWCAGVPPARAAAEHRARGVQARGALLDLCARIAEAYADLHDRGVLHGDVHDRNVLVRADGSVSLIDFGIACVPADPSIGLAPRGGVPAYYDPQLAEAYRRGEPPPVLDARAEQFSIAALLYLVATGATHLDLSPRREEALRQIVEDPPLSFETTGATPWPELEAVLDRALSRQPEDRYASLRALAQALRGVRPPASAAVATTRSGDRRRFVAALVERLAPGGPLYTHGLPATPLCGVNTGAAGIAYAFRRMAAAREDALMLAYADAWIVRARSWASTEAEAWYAHDGTVTARTVGSIALYHTATGLHCVETLIALARGDWSRAERCVQEFIAASRTRSTMLDVMLGKAGLVVGATLMLEASPTLWPELRRRTDDIVRSLETRIAGYGAMAGEPRLTSVGMAHGWSGFLWTLMRWHRTFGGAMPAWVEPRLQELLDLATPRGRGLAWNASAAPHEIVAEPNPAPTWCNGASGHVHTWLEAHAAFANDRYLDAARAAAWNIWDDPRETSAQACCGYVGRAYALLAVGRRTGDPVWRHRAEVMADRALDAVLPEARDAHQLYRGALGVALLLEELERAPDDARMPLFEAEGWRWEWR